MKELMIAYQRELSDDLRLSVFHLEQQHWPSASEDSLDLLHFMYLQDNRVIAHVGLDIKTMDLDDKTYRVAGICGVISDQAYQGKGYATLLLRECIRYIEFSDIPFSIFTCHSDLVGFYEHAGWHKSKHQLIGGSLEQPFYSKDLKLITMLYVHSSLQSKLRNKIEKMDIFIPLGEYKLW